MASDRQQFNRALRHWQELHDSQAYSVPVDVGKTAIAYSDTMDTATEGSESDVIIFAREAKDIAKYVKRCGGKAEVVAGASGNDMRHILHDPYFSTIITIGHGALSYLYLDNGTRQQKINDVITDTPNDRYDWRDVSHDADHLKLGYFLQRHCGNYARQLSVPLGTFALANQANIWAPVGQYFDPMGIWDRRENRRIRQAHDLMQLSYEAVKEFFNYTEFLENHCSEDLSS